MKKVVKKEKRDNSNQKMRDSNFELMRIISMFMIVVTHIIGHGYVVENCDGLTETAVALLKCLLYVHVNSFVLVTGYYQCKGKFKLQKIFSLNNAAWFYGLAIALFIIIFDLYPVSKLNLFRLAIPFQLNGYWFIKMYIYLYCLSPVLNLLISKIDQKYHKNIILVGFILFSIIPTITNRLTFDNDKGFSLPTFVFLYFVGSYFRKYPIDKAKIFETFSKYKQVCIIGAIFVGSIFINFLCFQFGSNLKHGQILGEIGKMITNGVYAYDGPIMKITSVCYFLLFYYLKIQSKFINNIGKLIMGIYLIHEQFLFNDFFYRYFGFDDIYRKSWDAPTDITIFIRIFITAVIVFVGCLIIEWIRQKIFKFIYNRKICCKYRKKFYNFIEAF